MRSKTLAAALLGLGMLCLQTPVFSQDWQSRIPKKPAEQLTVKDFQAAFNSWYADHPVDLSKDKVYPTFHYNEGEEQRIKYEIEQYKQFKRWEWFTEPRTWPEGRWNAEKVYNSRTQVPQLDRFLREKARQENPMYFKGEDAALPDIGGAWTALGPTNAVGGTNLGRVNCIEFQPGNTNVIYIGAPDGGIWKTTNGGTSWTPIFDHQPTISVGDIAIDPNNVNTVYASTSDAFGYTFEPFRFWGGTYSVGVMKSTNGGTTWTTTGLNWTVAQNRTIRRLVIHPTNSNILLAATSAGLWRTTNAGVTWTQIWATSTFDVEFQHNNGNIVYATTNTVQKSLDAGATWAALTATCAGARYNIEIARSNTNILYTLCTNGTVQKSTNAGATWANTTAPGAFLFGYYDNILAVSPVNANVVYVAGQNIRRTTDGGTTWAAMPVAGHVDNHAIEFFPGTDVTYLNGNDGGLFKTTNSGTTWTSLNNGLAITQFYRFGICRTNANIMHCGAQDNGNMRYNTGVWSNITNADGMENFIDWSNCNTVYAATQNGSLQRSFNSGATWTNISTGGGAWVTPWQQSNNVAATIFAATNRVYRSTNQGTTWTNISAAVPIGQYNSLKVAPSNDNVIYAANFSSIYRTSDGGVTWTNITAGLPVATNSISYITVNATNPNLAYVTFSGFTAGQKVYRTNNGGATWTNISGTLPNIPINCIEAQSNSQNAIYIGTDASVYYLSDGLTDWVPMKNNMPNVIVNELEINAAAGIIRACTFGRGIWQTALIPSYDLYIKDRPTDTGIEPFSGTPYLSEDIWIRNANDGVLTHQNPICGQGNFMKVRVRNRTTTAYTGTQAVVKFYWAKASSGLGWPNPWTGGINIPCNPFSIYLMGGQIGTVTIPNIPGLGSTILTLPWTPPPPSEYACFGADQFHFCLLARIEDVPAYPYGMTFPEQTGQLAANVLNNNNNAWKNVTVATSAGCARMGAATVAGTLGKITNTAMALLEGEKFSGQPSDMVDLTVAIEKERLIAADDNIIQPAAPIAFTDENGVPYQKINANGNIFDFNIVEVSLGQLIKGWSGSGQDIEVYDETGEDGTVTRWIRLLTPNAIIKGITLPADAQEAIRVRISQSAPLPDPNFTIYDMDLNMVGPAGEIGGNNFRVEMPATFTKTAGSAVTVISTEGLQPVKITGMTATEIQLMSQNGDRYAVDLMNSSGQVVSKGDFTGSTQLNIKDLPKGVYFMRLINTRTNERMVKKLALQ